MTADILKVLEMRDALVAAEVAKMAALGWFDKEFTIYGCTFFKGDERYYKLSAEPQKIYDFIEQADRMGYMPSNINMISRKYPVPIGMQDAVQLEVKKDLAKEMQQKYEKEFFSYMKELKYKAMESTGYEFLVESWNEIEGTFDKKAIERFSVLLDFVFSRGKISEVHYQALLARIKDELRNIEEEPVRKELYKKTLYASAYKINNSVKYIMNARKETVYRKQYELLQKGIFTTPIISETYYHGFDMRPAQLNQMFETEIKQVLTLPYLETLESSMCKNMRITKDEFELYLRETEEKFGQDAYETLKTYGYRWGILW